MASFSDDRATHTATIAASASVSGAVALGGSALVGVVLPATGSGDFAANTDQIRFQVSMDGTTYNTLADNDGTVVSLTVAANNTLGATYIDAIKTAAWRFVKVATHRSDTGAAVNQSASTVFTLVTAKVTG